MAASAKRQGARSIRIAVQVVLAAVILALTGAFVSFKHYVEHSPRFCQTCHDVAPEIAVWMESEHRQVRCQQCHHSELEDGLRILEVYVAGGNTEPRHAPVDVHSCAKCHASHDPRWPAIANSAGHRIHTEKAHLPCTACHGKQMHFDRPARQTCETCHVGVTTGASHAANHCLACHNFLTTEDTIRPQRSDCLRCHRNQDRPVVIDPTAPMQFSCAACHRPHDTNKLIACTDCHHPDDLAGLHSLHAQRGHVKCPSCHQPHNWVSRRAECYACHPETRSHHPEKSCTGCHRFETLLNTGP